MKTLEANVLDLIMTGEAARICGVDRRTFMAWSKKLGILPIAMPQGRALFEKKDVDKIKKKIDDFKKNNQ